MSLEVGEGGGRAVSPLELFFDLVFVFAISQLSHHLLENPTWGGALETLILTGAVFTVWLHAAWEATFLDIARRPTQLLLLAIMGAALFMNAGISGAWEDHPALFAVPLVLIQVARPVATSRLARDPGLRRHFRAMFVWLAVSAPLWLIGIAVHGPTRVLVWLVAAAIDVLGTITAHPLPGKRQIGNEEIELDGAHLQERLQLFLIIVLGEVVLTSGTALAASGVTVPALIAGAAAFVVVAALWALYFAGSADIVEDLVAHADTPMLSARIAGNTMYPTVAAMIAIAVGGEMAIAHPTGHGSLTLGLLLYGGALTYVAGQALFLRLTLATVSTPRLAGGALLLLGIGFAAVVPPLLALVSLAAILIGLAALLTRERIGRRTAGVSAR